jgi:PAT family beta-lactamase induction signal transducer AmpG
LIVTGSFAFLIAAATSWQTTHLILAALMIVIATLTTRVPEPPRIRPPETLREAVITPFAEFVSHLGARRALWTLLFVVLFRLGDAMVNNMATPFLVKTGFTLNDIGVIQGGVGFGATIVGALAAGGIANRVGIYRALWICGTLQAFSNLSYVVLAWAGHNYAIMIGTIVVENLCYGLGATALVGFLTTLCNPRFSATQYALLSSVVAAGRDLLASPAGKLAEVLGWSGFFLLTFIAALPALALLPLFTKKAGHPDQQVMMNT